MREYRIEQVISFFMGLLIIPLINWLICNSQTRDFVSKRPILKVPFSVFLKEFNKVKWILRDTSPNSLFTEYYWDSSIHAGILEIDNVGYELTIYGRFKLWLLKKKTIKKLRKEGGNKPMYLYKFE